MLIFTITNWLWNCETMALVLMLVFNIFGMDRWTLVWIMTCRFRPVFLFQIRFQKNTVHAKPTKWTKWIIKVSLIQYLTDLNGRRLPNTLDYIWQIAMHQNIFSSSFPKFCKNSSRTNILFYSQSKILKVVIFLLR